MWSKGAAQEMLGGQAWCMCGAENGGKQRARDRRLATVTGDGRKWWEQVSMVSILLFWILPTAAGPVEDSEPARRLAGNGAVTC